MMRVLVLAALLSGFFPLYCAWRANRSTSLLHAVTWAIVAWAAWTCASVSFDSAEPRAPKWLLYLALCFTGCAGIAVLGARRPGVTAWNFVVVGLLAVNTLPLARSLLRGLDLKLEWFQFVCVSATIAVGILNYLPTKFAPAAVLLLFVSGIYLWESLGDMVRVTPEAAGAPLRWLLLISPVPWFAFASSRVRRQPASQFDGIWLDFRDRFGFVWAQRLREQFNRSAIHASWPVVLRWQGLRLLPGTTLPREEIQDEMLATLQSLMKRFGPKNSGHAHEH